MDVKTGFYWRNRAQIEEWATLRRSATDLLIAELRAQVERLQELVIDTNDLVVIEVEEPALLSLTRPSWATRGIHLQVGLSWVKGTLLAATGVNRPWVGVR